jgi:hypothetical protein
MRDRLGEQDAYVVVVQGVDGLSASALPDDEPQVPEHAQLLGDRRLLHLDVARQLRDGARAGAEAAEDPHAAGCSERLHRLRDDTGGVAAQVCEVDIVTVTHADIIA